MLNKKIINATTAIEIYASGQTFKEILCFDTDRALDIFHYMKRNKLMATFYSKMSERETKLFTIFFNRVANFETYDDMCNYINEFTNNSKVM